MRRRLDDAAQTLDRHSRRLLNPTAQLRQQRLQLLALSTAMTHATRAPLNQSLHALDRLRHRWAALRPDVTVPRARLQEAQRRSGAAIDQLLARRRHQLGALAAQLELLNPQRTLERGYAIVRDEKGHIVRAPAQLQARQQLHLRLAEGSAEVGIASVQTVME
jgi:exodeoxyribonuclease VII large subunit